MAPTAQLGYASAVMVTARFGTLALKGTHGDRCSAPLWPPQRWSRPRPPVVSGTKVGQREVPCGPVNGGSAESKPRANREACGEKGDPKPAVYSAQWVLGTETLTSLPRSIYSVPSTFCMIFPLTYLVRV